MFYEARKFNQDISKWNTANVTSFHAMLGCFGQQNISSWRC